MSHFRLLVCGSRDWTDEPLLYTKAGRCLDGLLRKGVPLEAIVVIHGGARGADSIFGRWAEEQGLAVEVHPADWETYGRSAGAMRNIRMSNMGITAALAFTTGTELSKGTAHMVGLILNKGVPVMAFRDDGACKLIRPDARLF